MIYRTDIPIPGIFDSIDINKYIITNVKCLLQSAVCCDGAHHKQWYLEEIAKQLNCELPEHDKGIAP